jgi:hypothetical protein
MRSILQRTQSFARLGTSKATSPVVALGPAEAMRGHDGVLGRGGVRKATVGSLAYERAHRDGIPSSGPAMLTSNHSMPPRCSQTAPFGAPTLAELVSGDGCVLYFARRRADSTGSDLYFARRGN